MMNRQVAVADSMANAGSTARTTIIPPCYSPLRASLSSHRQQQRGSLPLKKRRFLDLSNNSYEYQLQPKWQQSSMETPSSYSSSKKLDSSPYSPDSTTNNPLLALVAAASVSTEPPSSLYSTSTTPSCVSHPTEYSKPYHYPYSLSAASSSSTSSSCYNVIPEEEQQDVVQPMEEVSVENNKRQQQRGGRIHHPPLSSPLPGGCHGRTSRNNSYCRRQPCYNGSNFCKLHYQQYIVVSGKNKEEVDGSSNSAVAVVERAQQEQEQPSPLQHSAKHVVHHQDKRFTGLSTEQRCQATTTRGRACAYVSVNGTLYCHLHADYDTNPPPRRGGGSVKKEEVLKQQQVLPPPPPIMSAASPATTQQPLSSSPPSVTSESSSSSSATTSSSVMAEPVAGAAITTPKTKKNQKRVVVNNSPYPLLCSVSSDQWYDKLVLISTGPLKNHTGRVKKWGNGWVTVQTSSEALLHNRRSVELLLLPNDYETINAAVQQQESAIGTTTQNDEMKTTTAVQVDAVLEKGTKKQEDAGNQGDDECEKGVKKQEKELKTGELNRHEPPSLKETTSSTAQGGGLLRCVSREADVPPPSTSTPAIVMESNPSTSLEHAPKEESEAAAPAPPVMVESNNNSSSTSPKKEEVGRLETKEKPAAVAASEEKEESIVPVPKEESSLLLPERQSTPEAQPEKELLQTRATDPTPVKQESFSQQQPQPQLVTPNSPRKVTAHNKNGDSDGPPLVDCLLAAQEGRRTNTKFNMDLLFGTAALERSRRTVHKPTRYEDTAMLERKRSRMNSTIESSSDDASSSDSVKRKRVDA